MKNDKKIFILIETILAVLALIVALFMIEEWADTEVRKISVVVQDSDGSRWAAFKYGLEMAASDNDVEVFVVSTGGTLTAEEEKELLETEVENGADGIIVQPVPGSGEEGFLEKINKKVPVIQVESAGDAEGGASDLPVAEPDHYAVGQALAEELKKDFGGSLHGKTIGIFQREEGTEAAKRREAGAKDCIRRAGGEILWTVSGYTGKGGELALPAYPPVDIMLRWMTAVLYRRGKLPRTSSCTERWSTGSGIPWKPFIVWITVMWNVWWSPMNSMWDTRVCRRLCKSWITLTGRRTACWCLTRWSGGTRCFPRKIRIFCSA